MSDFLIDTWILFAFCYRLWIYLLKTGFIHFQLRRSSLLYGFWLCCSSLQRAVFSLQWCLVLWSCRLQACELRGVACQLSDSWLQGLSSSVACGSSRTRGWTGVPCIGRGESPTSSPPGKPCVFCLTGFEWVIFTPLLQGEEGHCLIITSWRLKSRVPIWPLLTPWRGTELLLLLGRPSHWPPLTQGMGKSLMTGLWELASLTYPAWGILLQSHEVGSLGFPLGLCWCGCEWLHSSFQWAFGWNRVFIFYFYFFVDYPFSVFLTRWQTLSELIFLVYACWCFQVADLASSLGCTR